MASSSLNTSVTADFEALSGVDEDNVSILWEEDVVRSAALDIGYKVVRLYPTEVKHRFSTTGTITFIGRWHETITEHVNFTGGNTANLPKPNAYNVSTKLLGAFIALGIADTDTGGVDPVHILSFLSTPNATPQVFTPTITYNAEKNQLESDVAGFGTVEVTYTVDFDLFNFSYQGGPCPDLASQKGGVSLENVYKASLLVAIDEAANHATLPMSPPNCEGYGYGVLTADTFLPKVRVIVDPEIKPRFKVVDDKDIAKMSKEYFPFDAYCKIRVIPSSNSVTMQSDAGHFTKDNVDDLTQSVEDAVTFSGSGSASLQYFPVVDSIGITKIGEFYDEWGNTVSDIVFRKPGEKITTAEWKSSSNYEKTGQRFVMEDELVAVNFKNVQLNVYGAVKVKYRYTYNRYTLVFESIPGSTSNQTKDRFKKANLFAFAESLYLDEAGMVASLSVNPPNIKIE